MRKHTPAVSVLRAGSAVSAGRNHHRIRAAEMSTNKVFWLVS